VRAASPSTTCARRPTTSTLSATARSPRRRSTSSPWNTCSAPA